MSDGRTYVFGDLEVILTGREATKTIPVNKRRGADAEARVYIVYEITPADKEEGSWKKWVKKTDLYEIEDE